MHQQSIENEAHGGHAVVIGGSVAGLVAARVLADHFDRVTLIERDRFPGSPEFRAGVPQSRHLHILLGRGQAILDQLFPGLTDEVTAAGAPAIDWPRDMLWLSTAGWSERFRTGVIFLCASRELLEWSVRRRLASLGRVRFLEEREATGLLANPEKTRVQGVQVRSRPAGDDAVGVTEEIAADFVVDASGRHSRTPRWLAGLGYSPPAETTINAFLGYSSRHYARPPGWQADWQAIFVPAKPPDFTRGGILFPIEGNRWLVTLVGVGRDYPATDEAGFLDFARSLRSPIIYETIKDAEPLSPIRGYQRTENHLRHYERLRRWPEHFVVLGDAACAFNPVYGQGMTVAAQSAMVLDQGLREHRRPVPDAAMAGVGKRIQRAIARSNAGTWLLATAEDLRYPTTEGGRSSVMARVMQHYVDRVLRVGTENPRVMRAFLDVLNLHAAPPALFRPEILIPVLRGKRRPILDAPAALPSLDDLPAPTPRKQFA